MSVIIYRFLFAHKSAMSRLMFLMSRTNKETKLLRKSSQSQLEIGLGFDSPSNCQFKDFSKFYGKVGVRSWLHFYLISFEKIMFYTEILTLKVEIWLFFLPFNLWRNTGYITIFLIKILLILSPLQ